MTKNDPAPPDALAWRIGDVYTDGTYRWKVLSVAGDKAVLQSCGSSWATTIPLTFNEWREGGRWQREAPTMIQAGAGMRHEP